MDQEEMELRAAYLESALEGHTISAEYIAFLLAHPEYRSRPWPPEAAKAWREWLRQRGWKQVRG